MVDKQTRDYDRLQAAEVLLEVHEDQVAAARDDVAVKRDAGRRQPRRDPGSSRPRRRPPRRRSSRWWGSGRRPGPTRPKIRARDVRKLKQAEREKKAIEARLRAHRGPCARPVPAPRAAARAPSVGPTSGLLQMPVGGGVTSPFGYRTHPIYGYWGLHDGTDFGGGCGAADGGGRGRQGHLVLLERRLRQPADRRQRRPRRRRHRDDLQPRDVATPSASARRSSAARSSATSATPAGPPAATCTSR